MIIVLLDIVGLPPLIPIALFICLFIMILFEIVDAPLYSYIDIGESIFTKILLHLGPIKHHLLLWLRQQKSLKIFSAT